MLPLRRIAAKRALSNLVDNALRHGRAPVRLRIHDEGPMLAVEVSDAGAGIAEDDRAGLAPFVQLDPRAAARALALASRSRSGSRKPATAAWSSERPRGWVDGQAASSTAAYLKVAHRQLTYFVMPQRGSAAPPRTS